jgi:hypothetical protein
MKKDIIMFILSRAFVVLFLIVALASCAPAAPLPPELRPTQTPAAMDCDQVYKIHVSDGGLYYIKSYEKTGDILKMTGWKAGFENLDHSCQDITVILGTNSTVEIVKID